MLERDELRADLVLLSGVASLLSNAEWRSYLSKLAAFAKVDDLNSACFAGHDEWRLTNQFELFSLVNLGPRDVTVDPIFRTSCPEGCTGLTSSWVGTQHPTAYWSSTTYLN